MGEESYQLKGGCVLVYDMNLFSSFPSRHLHKMAGATISGYIFSGSNHQGLSKSVLICS